MFLFSSLESISQQQEFLTLAVNEIISGEKPFKMFFSFLVVVFLALELENCFRIFSITFARVSTWFVTKMNQ